VIFVIMYICLAAMRRLFIKSSVFLTKLCLFLTLFKRACVAQ
jgi:hypothetical protein